MTAVVNFIKWLFDDMAFYVSGQEKLNHEIQLARERFQDGDNFPQSLEVYIQTIEEAKQKGKNVHIVLKKTLPHLSWIVMKGE